MLPEFDTNGNLPPGIHQASLVEIAERFGRGSEVRRVEMQSLCWLAELAAKTGVRRLVVNGSFATEVFEPNDVNCVLLIGPDFPRNQVAAQELLAGLPFLHIQLVRQSEFDWLISNFFTTDKRGQAKGMIEVIPWRFKVFANSKTPEQSFRLSKAATTSSPESQAETNTYAS